MPCLPQFLNFWVARPEQREGRGRTPPNRHNPGRIAAAAACLLPLLVAGRSARAQYYVVERPIDHCPCACESAAASTDARPHTSLRPIAGTAIDAGLVVELHEGLLNRILRRTDERQGPVRDFVLGADVHGTETTTTSIGVDLLPSENGVSLELVLQGRNRAETVGYTPQAAVRTLGQHQFTARKRVTHDGRLFGTQRPQVEVVPFNQTVGVDTPVNGVPILGDVASSIGFQAAESQRSQGEQIAAQKIREGVGTEFNRRVDDELTKLNRGWLETVGPQLQQRGFDEFAIAAESTSDWARYAVDLPAPETALSVPQRAQRPVTGSNATQHTARRAAAENVADGVVGRVAVRAEFIDNIIARLGLAGATFKAADFAEPAAAALGVVESLEQHGLEIGAIPPEAAAALQSLVLRFDGNEPLRVAFTPGMIWVRARAALSLPPLLDLPVLQVTARYRLEILSDGVTQLTPFDLQLAPANDGDAALNPLAALLESQAKSAMPTIRLPRELRLPVPDAEPVLLRMHELKADDGVLTATVR
ncbi:MAG: hypothetical protein JNG89_00880 [Planctomycetaceae bacterium]|nr:hypothetical protein [Planctomycetaceae bacterium]